MSIDKKSLIQDCIDLVGEENIISNKEELKKYGFDLFNNAHTPTLVVKPSSPLHFKRLFFILRRYKIDSITPRGLGLGLNLGAYSTDLIIDLSLLNKNLEIDLQNFVITTQAGQSFSDIQHKLAENGYQLPIEPLLNGTLGGFIASGGYGYGSYRYGTVMNILHNTTVVLSNGQILQSGTLKLPPFACGYNLNSLICGSEGFLGIITDATLEIVPQPQHTLNLILTFKNINNFSEFLKKISNLTTVYHISLYKNMPNINSETLTVFLRLEGLPKAVDQDFLVIKKIQGLELAADKTANELWENRFIKPTQIPKSNLIIETIIPSKQLLEFLRFCDAMDSPTYFGILLNASTALFYVFLTNCSTETKKNEILSKFLKSASDLQVYPPTIGNNIKEFIESHSPNFNILKQLKIIFDKANLMKTRKFTF